MQFRRGAKGVCLFLLIGFGFHGPASLASESNVCEPKTGYIAGDTSRQVDQEFLKGLKSAGIGTVIRYYDWQNETLEGKTLTQRELDLIAELDMSVAVVFQHHNDCLCTFVQDVNNPDAKRESRGTRDAKRSLELAKSFSQPQGSAIYFGVDGVDADFVTMLQKIKISEDEIRAIDFIRIYIDKYFTDISEVMKSSGYKIGIYGSGAVCKYLLEKKLADYCWLAAAVLWPGYESFEKTKKWVLKQEPPTNARGCFSMEVDLNMGNGSTTEFGQWRPKR